MRFEKGAKLDLVGIEINEVLEGGDYSIKNIKTGKIGIIKNDDLMFSLESYKTYPIFIGGQEYKGFPIKHEGDLVGGIDIDFEHSPDSYEIGGIYLKPKYRGLGIASRIINSLPRGKYYVKSIPGAKKFWEKIGVEFGGKNEDSGLFEGYLNISEKEVKRIHNNTPNESDKVLIDMVWEHNEKGIYSSVRNIGENYNNDKVLNDVYTQYSRLGIINVSLESFKEIVNDNKIIDIGDVTGRNKAIDNIKKGILKENFVDILHDLHNKNLGDENKGKGKNYKTYRGYHGTDSNFEKFEKNFRGSANGNTPTNKAGIFFSDKIEIAKTFGKNIKKVDIELSNPMIIDVGGVGYGDPYKNYDKFKFYLNDLLERIDKSKYDGLIVKNYKDCGKYGSKEILGTQIIPFYEFQIKIIKNIIDEQLEKRNEISKKWSDLSNIPLEKIASKEERNAKFKELDIEREKLLFGIMWEDTVANFNLVYKEALKSFKGEILAKRVGLVGRKNRRDIYVMTSDNLEFKKLFYSTLDKMVKEDKTKKLDELNLDANGLIEYIKKLNLTNKNYDYKEFTFIQDYVLNKGISFVCYNFLKMFIKSDFKDILKVEELKNKI